MIHLLSIRDADRNRLDPLMTHCISPYLNPGHVLAPPRAWLESLIAGEISWPFLRLRYKNLLRNRYRDNPEPFFELLEDSESFRAVYLTCHCVTDHCHREIAHEFLEQLRERRPYREWRSVRLPHLVPGITAFTGLTQNSMM